MEWSTERALRRLSVTAAVIAALAVGFASGGALAESGRPVAESQMHEEMHSSDAGMTMGGHRAEIDDMHAQRSAGLSDDDRAPHDRMDEACGRSHGWRGDSTNAVALSSEMTALRQRQSDACTDDCTGTA